tara:strand:+ start:677 stop:937 length:261 start_codon:yes stop_codon:yes gene_type:complete
MHKKKEIKSLDGNSLSKTIKQETISYLKKMNGTGISNLHNLFISETEKILISTVLDFLGGNVTKTADYLGINRGTLIKRIKDYKIQ